MSGDEKLKEYRKLVAQLNSTTSLHFIYYEKDIESFIGDADAYNKLEIAIKKGLFYSNHIVILTKEKSALHKYGDGTDNNFDDYDLLFKESDALKKISKSFDADEGKQDLLRFTSFLPEKLVYNQYYTNSFYHSSNSTDIIFDFKKEYQNKAGVPIALTIPCIKNHIFENYYDSSYQTGIINFCLPELQNISLETLLKIREDEGDSFIRFQHSIKKFLNGIDDVKSETMLFELFQYVDYHVREMEQKMINLSKMKALTATNAIVGSALMGLTFFLPPDIAKAVLAVLGSFQLKEYKDKLFQTYEKRNNLKSSDFYAPWLIHNKRK